jgi:hypothetical protein
MFGTGLDQVDIKRTRDQLFFDGPETRPPSEPFWAPAAALGGDRIR